MPKLGESIMEATILKWHKQAGDQIKMDETLLEIATDKVDSEVPSTAEGTIHEILFKINEVVPIGKIIARINTVGSSSISAQTISPIQEAVLSNSKKSSPVIEENLLKTSSTNGKFYSPLVLTIASNESVSMVELESIYGTGNDGRVTKKDILQYVTERGQSSVFPIQEVIVVNKTSSHSANNTQITTYSGNVEIIEMDRMRKLIADHMVRSKHTSPHVTSFTEADVSNMVLWREKVKKEFEKREGTKITFMPLFIEAVVKCIKKFPLMNCSLDGNKIIIKKDINIGMATALQSGNLIVPVIKNADQLNLVGLAKQVNTLADNARNGKLKPDDTNNGTFTITNVGSFGSLMGTPIINQPQVAILAVGVIKKRPVVVETPHGDSIAIRHMMYLSMSYDHRIVDGSLGATFLTAVAKELENFNGERDY